LALWLWEQSPYSRFLGHHRLALITEDIAFAPAFQIGRIVMIIAMMLPSSLPLIAQFDNLCKQN
jgi:predicted metal-binding membrane protein